MSRLTRDTTFVILYYEKGCEGLDSILNSLLASVSHIERLAYLRRDELTYLSAAQAQISQLMSQIDKSHEMRNRPLQRWLAVKHR